MQLYSFDPLALRGALPARDLQEGAWPIEIVGAARERDRSEAYLMLNPIGKCRHWWWATGW